MRWGIVIIAGGTETGDLVTRMGTDHKGLAQISGSTSLARTVAAVRESGLGPLRVVGPEEFRPLLQPDEWVAEADGAIQNVLVGLDALPAECEAILTLPADTPLMRGEHLTDFCRHLDGIAWAEPAWVATGLCPVDRFLSEYPGTPAVALRVRGAKVVTGGLFAGSPAGLRAGAGVAREFRELRRHPFQMLRRIGYGTLWRYLLGRITLDDASKILGDLLGSRVFLWPHAHPATCMDFDNVAEFEAVLRFAR